MRSTSEEMDCQPYDPENSFHEAVCRGELIEALHLLASKKFNINHRDTGKRTALHFASFYGHVHLVNFLLLNGSEINALDKKKCTPLVKAVQSRKNEIVFVLLDERADPNIKDINGESAIHQAVYVDNLDILSNLLTFGGDIEDQTKDGFTPLLLALRERKLHIAEYLITHGANIHACDNYRRTTLMYAVKWDSKELVDLLLKKDVQHSARDKFRWSALMYAIVGKRQVKTAIVNHVNSVLSRKQNTFSDIIQQDIPENTLENSADDLPTASTEYEDIEAQEDLSEELELETIPDLKLEDEDASDKNEGYQNLESSRTPDHTSSIGNDAEINEMNQDKDVSGELKEEMPAAKQEEEKTFDNFEENQEFVCKI
ncbi:putative ankyrin repeat domain-containing protein 19 [Mesocricetus auratus]|uniref:Ankyrin repeat domain-containing protein 19 n=1 Tax=Mesocricetus auratus TaxID=10036 RepID=A0ABM2WD13_MESAU|nr:putative ankyrin repeat domain-containing protein 19 [Mesocricetus auratus]